jgi:hypothetical protein
MMFIEFVKDEDMDVAGLKEEVERQSQPLVRMMSAA